MRGMAIFAATQTETEQKRNETERGIYYFRFTKSKSVQPKKREIELNSECTVSFVSEFKLRTPQLPSDSLSKEVKINERKSKWSFTVFHS